MYDDFLYEKHASNIIKCYNATKCLEAVRYFENLQNYNTLYDINEIRKLLYQGYFCLGDLKTFQKLERNKYTITFYKHLNLLEQQRNEKEMAKALQRFGIAGLSSFLTGVFVLISNR